MDGYGTSREQSFNKNKLLQKYTEHNDFLKIDVASPNSFPQFLAFIGERSSATSFPWKNKT